MLTAISTIAAIVGLIVAVLAAVFAWRALYPQKRQVTISYNPPAALLSEVAEEAQVDLIIDGKPAGTDPHVVTILIENTGRYDIVDAQFNSDHPISIDFGATVSKVLKQAISPDRGYKMPCDAEGTQIRLGPGSLSRGQKVTITLLTLEKPTSFQISHDLIDVEVAQSAPRSGNGASESSRRALLRAMAISVVGAFVAVVATLLLTILADTPTSKVTPGQGPPGTLVTVSGKNYLPFEVIGVEFPSSALRSPTGGSSPTAIPSPTAGGGTASTTSDLVLATTQVNEDGRFSVRVIIPANATPGRTRLQVVETAGSYEEINFGIERP